jgi:autotransporter-associated beta strand protein
VYDSRPNNFVSGGQLRLTTQWNGTDWIAGGLYTSQFMQRFGYYETTMQIGRDDGLNNAFWLYTPFNHANNVDVLEIDITEAHFHDHNHVNVHDWKPTHTSSGATQTVADIYPGYHRVGLEWTTSGELRWFWDGALVRTMAASELNGMENMTPMQVMFSTKVIPFAGTPGPTLDGSSMDIAYARVWMKPGWLGTQTGNWGTTQNWGPDGVPGAGDAAVFNQAVANTTVSLLSDKSVKELYFTTPQCPPMTLAAGSFKLLLGALASGSGVGGILVNGDVTTAQTINTAIEARQNLSFLNYSATPDASLSVNGALTSNASGRQLTLGGDGRVNLGGSLSSQFDSVTKVNAGAAWLTAANAHTGLTDVQNGALVVAANGALGAAGAGTVVASGATLALAGGVVYSAAETVDFQGNGESGWQGALDLADDSSVSFAGPLVLDAAARIGSGSGSGTLTLASALDTTAAGFALSFNGTGTTVLNGAITGAGSVTKMGTGTLRLNEPASHTGITTVSDGTLITTLANLPGSVTNFGTLIYEQAADATFAGNWGGTGSVVKQGAGTITVAAAQSTTGGLTVQGGTVKAGINEAFSGSLDLTVNGGTFDLNGFTETLGPVVLDGGSIINSTGTSAQYLAGTTFDVRSGTASARLGGNGALTKTTNGTATLSGANTFTGSTTVQAGTLELAGSLNSALTVAGGTLGLGATTGIRTVNASAAVNSGGTLRIRINGPTAGTQHDRLTVGGSVTLAGALDVIAAPGLASGTTFTIVSKTTTGAVSGTFTGKPQGSIFAANGSYFAISYTGGDGNDVTLTTATAQQLWRFTHFGTVQDAGTAADTFDANGDGENNLMEFATAQNPLATTTTAPASGEERCHARTHLYAQQRRARRRCDFHR